MKTVVYDTKPYDRASLEPAAGNGELEWSFKEFRLNAETAAAAQARGRSAFSSMTARIARVSKHSLR